MERSHPHHPLLLLVVGVGLLAAEVAGYEPDSCAMLALHIDKLSYPVTEKDRGGASCEVVRSVVDSSLAAAAAAAAGVTPCLCLLDDYVAFLVTGFTVQEVPGEIYAPCGGQHVKEAQRLAEKCDEGACHCGERNASCWAGVLARLSYPSEKGKDKYGAVEDEAICAATLSLMGWLALCPSSSRQLEHCTRGLGRS